MNVERLGKFGEGLFTADGGKGHLRFKKPDCGSGGVVWAWLSPVLGKIADLQAEISPNHPVQISRTTSPKRFKCAQSVEWSGLVNFDFFSLFSVDNRRRSSPAFKPINFWEDYPPLA